LFITVTFVFPLRTAVSALLVACLRYVTGSAVTFTVCYVTHCRLFSVTFVTARTFVPFTVDYRLPITVYLPLITGSAFLPPRCSVTVGLRTRLQITFCLPLPYYATVHTRTCSFSDSALHPFCCFTCCSVTLLPDFLFYHHRFTFTFRFVSWSFVLGWITRYVTRTTHLRRTLRCVTGSFVCSPPLLRWRLNTALVPAGLFTLPARPAYLRAVLPFDCFVSPYCVTVVSTRFARFTVNLPAVDYVPFIYRCLLRYVYYTLHCYVRLLHLTLPYTLYTAFRLHHGLLHVTGCSTAVVLPAGLHTHVHTWITALRFLIYYRSTAYLWFGFTLFVYHYRLLPFPLPFVAVSATFVLRC